MTSTMDICRACLSSDKTMQWDKQYLETFNKLTDLSAKTNDNLPQALCNNCRDLLNNFIDFRAMCIQSENSILNVKLEDKEKKLDIPVLTLRDIKIENDDDDFLDYDFVNEDALDDSLSIKPELVLEEYVPPPVQRRGPRKKKAVSVKVESSAPIHRGNKRTIKPVKKYQGDIKTSFKVFDCGLCTEKLRGREILQLHIQKHTKKLSCEICMKNVDTSQELIMHRFDHIDADQRYCHLCCRKFRLLPTIQHHYIADHGPKGPSTTCNFCGGVFQTIRKLKKHLSSTHADLKYTCDICQKKFRSKQNIKMHMIQHTGVKLAQCPDCHVSFKYHHQLKTHKRRVHGVRQYFCKNCGRHFEKEATIKTHKCDQTLVCSYCGKMFSTNKSLTRHMEVHSDVCKYKCAQCPAEYKTRGALAAHKNRHAGIRPYSCEYCPLTFFTASVLIKHRRVHTGERPYVCTLCGKGFSANHNLKVHMKVHGINNLIVSKHDQENKTDLPLA